MNLDFEAAQIPASMIRFFASLQFGSRNTPHDSPMLTRDDSKVGFVVPLFAQQCNFWNFFQIVLPTFKKVKCKTCGLLGKFLERLQRPAPFK